METYKISLKVVTADAQQAKTLADLLQDVAGVVAYDDMIKLLAKVKQKPAVVKTALKFI